VVDLSGLAGAYGTRVWAALGAEVIKVEPPEGSPLRRLEPLAPGVAAPENGLWWAYFAAGCSSVVIDPASEESTRRLAALLRTADVVVDSAAAAAQAVRAAEVRAANQGVVWVAITPFGLTGPRRDWAGNDFVGWASSGLTKTLGFPERPPLGPAPKVQLGMHITALNAVTAAMLALRARRRTGHGQIVDLSVQECLLAVAPETGVPLYLDDQVPRPRAGNRRPVTSPFGIFPCRDGFVAMLVLQPAHWRAMAAWIAEECDNEGVLDEVFSDMTVRNEASDAVDAWTEALTVKHSKLELFLEAQRRGIPLTPVNTVADLRADPHLQAAGWWREEHHPHLGSYPVPGAPFRTNHDWWAWTRAPLLGEHTDAVLADLALTAPVAGPARADSSVGSSRGSRTRSGSVGGMSSTSPARSGSTASA
jgi:crotonobetainyl-CoA:carnitine CoA-transferase CaiB-like acyl-CoA transferase